jgi:hypothetical protein
VEETPENIAAFRAALHRLRIARIAAAFVAGWPLEDDVDSAEYDDCQRKVEKAANELAEYPSDWPERFGTGH